MKISSVTNTNLSFIIANHQTCGHCMVVDQHMERLERGYLCPICKMPGNTGYAFFDLNILTLIDLIQEAFHTKPWKTPEFEHVNNNAHSLSVLIFFCTLREILLERIIYNLMNLHEIPKCDRDRLLSENRMFSAKRDKLFPNLLGMKNWKEAIKTLQGKTGNDYKEINAFLKAASDMRNDILHEGDKWSFEEHMKYDCLENIPALLGLYVDFHNAFIHPVNLERLAHDN
jgi:hypothetical protein